MRTAVQLGINTGMHSDIFLEDTEPWYDNCSKQDYTQQHTEQMSRLL